MTGVFFNGNDWVVAKDYKDAAKAWSEFTGDDWFEDGYVDENDSTGGWEQLAGDAELRLYCSPDWEPISKLENVRNLEDDGYPKADPDTILYSATAEDWSRAVGRGWLGSMEW